MIAFIFFTLGCGGGAGGGQAGSTVSPFSGSVSTAFTAGISHIDGKYRFTQNNYLLEGAQKISALGSSSIFIYLTPSFRSDYPDESRTTWPASDPAGVDGLAQTGPYDQVFHLLFKTIVMTTVTFANADRVRALRSHRTGCLPERTSSISSRSISSRVSRVREKPLF